MYRENNYGLGSAEVEACVASVLDKYGRIDGAANCAGSIILKPAHSTTEEEFSQTIATNLNSSFSLMRCLARPMMKQKSGSIVFCSSAVAKIGLSNHEAIAAAKVALQYNLPCCSCYSPFCNELLAIDTIESCSRSNLRVPDRLALLDLPSLRRRRTPSSAYA